MPPPIERNYINPGPVQFSYNLITQFLTKLPQVHNPIEQLREVSRLCSELQSVALG